MRVLKRLSALAGGVALIMSCDGGPVSQKFGNGIAGGATGTAPITPPAAGSIDSTVPFVRIDTPVAVPQMLINAGDSILVVTRLVDDRKLGNLTLRGIQYKGSASLGTLTEIDRYVSVSAPTGAQVFRPGLQDTIIRRYLKAATPVDTSIDSLVITAVLRDSAGNIDSTRRVVQLVNGPKVTITAPVANDSVPRGIAFSISVTADQPSGIDSIEIITTGEASWPTKLNDTLRVKYGAGVTQAVQAHSVVVPFNAPARGKITINARARDQNRNQGNAPPIVIFARAVSSVAPRVTQTVPPKLEYGDSITITATADGVKRIGRILLDSALAVVDSIDTVFVSPFKANETVRLPNRLGLNDQGRRLSVISFAIDSADVIGYSLATGSGIPITNRAQAWRDTVLITYGRTYSLPRAGVIGDLAVDEIRGNVFLSNTGYNLLEVWNNTSKSYTGSVQVGAQPWGLFVSQFGANRDTLLVANSGSTTISKVDMAAATPTEALSKRIRTRNIVDFEVVFALNAGITTISYDGKINSFSDRPQYVAQSAGGRIFYSTKPTDAKTPGTIRWLDPALPQPDAKQIWTYGRTNSTASAQYVLFHLDSLSVLKASVTGVVGAVDTITVCDHPYGQVGGDFCVTATSVAEMLTKAQALGSDVEAVLGLDLKTLSLTDTNFVAASGDRNWVAFGEGNAAKYTGTVVDAGIATPRVMLVNDPGGAVPGFFSHAIHVDDIQENASDKVFGLALDSTGLQLIGHGEETFVAAIDLPFHLRLDGVYNSFDNGAGVAFHPRAKATNTAAANDRIAFTATRSGVIEALDVAHYNNRGKFTTKGNLYGPLRVTPPLPGDPGTVILKLYGLTDRGLIVIDLQAQDILP